MGRGEDPGRATTVSFPGPRPTAGGATQGPTLTTPIRSTATPNADRLLERAQRHVPGAVSAAARINGAIGRPMFIGSGDGPWLTDVDGRRFLDTDQGPLSPSDSLC